jgi:hypothetical protein
MAENYDTILVSISSKDCSTGSGSGPGGCTFDVTNNCLQDVVSFRVKDVSVPKTFYTVESSTSRQWDITLYFIGNVSGAFTITIPQGIYTIAQMLAAIDAQILAVAATTTVSTVDPITQRIVITRTAGANATLQIDPAGAGANVYGLNRLGFYTQVALATTITADTGYVLVLTQSLLLQSTSLGSYRNMASGIRPGPAMSAAINKSNVIYRAYLNQVNSQDFVTCVIPSTYYQLFVSNLTKLDFQLTDDEGNGIDLRNQTWSCTLEFLIKKSGA